MSEISSILFVCLGNICRSPAAEGLLKHMLKEEPKLHHLHVESCGLGNWHVGQLPDERMRDAAKLRSVVLSSRAQQFDLSFLDRFDLILAADHEILNELYRHAKSPKHKAKIRLITAFSKCYPNENIGDPFYQGDAAFERILDIIEDSCEGLIAYLKES